MYKIIIRPLLFLFPPEIIHGIVFTILKIFQILPGGKQLFGLFFNYKSQLIEKEVFGIKFLNPIGLAAGMDKDAEVFDILGYMGFGHVEVGTVTPKPQPGNPKPRSFRLKKNNALINRMGFNNNGVEEFCKKLKQKKSNIVIGGNIGKNKITPNDSAINDYVINFDKIHEYVDYFAINVSSPNTPNLRELQDKEPLKKLLSTLKQKNSEKNIQKPILLKIAPDLTNAQLDDIIEIVDETKIDGLIATNTTISRNGISYTKEQIESFGSGGLSGKPLKDRSTEVIRYLHQKSEGKFPIIGVGGVFTAEDAIEKLEAGASLIQVYTGFIYEGPAIVKKINRGLIKYYKNKQNKN